MTAYATRPHPPTPSPQQRPLAAGGAALLLLMILAQSVGAHELQPEDMQRVGFEQHLGQAVPLELGFRDEAGRVVSLGEYFRHGPVVLTLNQLHCKNLCPVELQGLIDGLNGVPFTMGEQFTLLTVSIDPKETADDAATAKARGLREYARPQGANGWHVLTSDHDTIDTLTEAVGFNDVYDPQEDEFAHPAGVVVLTPSGQISRYIYGIDFSTTDLRLAMVEAAADKFGTLVDRALLVCYHYDPHTGRYTPLVLGLMQAGAVAGVLGLGSLVGWLIYRGKG